MKNGSIDRVEFNSKIIFSLKYQSRTFLEKYWLENLINKFTRQPCFESLLGPLNIRKLPAGTLNLSLTRYHLVLQVLWFKDIKVVRLSTSYSNSLPDKYFLQRFNWSCYLIRERTTWISQISTLTDVLSYRSWQRF